jgi:hypothetical protein
MFNHYYRKQGPRGERGPTGPRGRRGEAAPDTATSTVIIPTAQLVPASIVTSSGTAGEGNGNLLRPGLDKWWISDLDTESDEGVTFIYEQPVLPTFLYMSYANGRIGSNIVLQGSNNGTDWTTLHTVDDNLQIYANDDPNTPFYAQPIVGNVGTYVQLRLWSQPSPYCMWYHVSIHGFT